MIHQNEANRKKKQLFDPFLTIFLPSIFLKLFCFMLLPKDIRIELFFIFSAIILEKIRKMEVNVCFDVFN